MSAEENHKNSNDLIESVTAEIEAFIQEEINLQTAGSENSEITKVIEDKVEQVLSETPVTEEAETTAAQAMDSQVKAEILSLELIEPSSTEKADEEIVAEYIVEIASTPQKPTEEVAEEIVKSVPVVPLIETILCDAPVDENDGPRAKHLKQALRKALNNTIKSCSGDKLENCFPFNLKADQFSQINSTILLALKSVVDGVQEPFDEFLKMERLVEKLNKVDEFTRSRVPGTSEVEEAARIAALSPQNLIDRKLFGVKSKSLAQLEQYVLKIENENSRLSSDLNNRQTEFADRLDRLKSSQQLLDAALDQISTISMNDLEVLVDKMNHQYQPSALKFQN